MIRSQQRLAAAESLYRLARVTQDAGEAHAPAPAPAAIGRYQIRGVLVCAGDHGHVGKGSSLYGPEVSAQVAAAAARGETAVGVLARRGGHELLVADVGLATPTPAGVRDAKDLVIEVRVTVGPDGVARQAVIVDQGRLGDPIFRAAAESARRTFFHPECTPLRVPAGKYELWKDLVVSFSPKDLL